MTLLEPGDTAIIAQNGVFGGRMAEIAQRAGAEVRLVSVEWGKPVDPEAVRASILEAPQAKLLAFVHAETSTGVRSDAASSVPSRAKRGCCRSWIPLRASAGFRCRLTNGRRTPSMPVRRNVCPRRQALRRSPFPIAPSRQ